MKTIIADLDPDLSREKRKLRQKLYKKLKSADKCIKMGHTV